MEIDRVVGAVFLLRVFFRIEERAQRDMDQKQGYAESQISYKQERPRFLQRHPVLTPLLFFSGSVFLSIACFFADSTFSLLAAFGVPSMPFCLSLALILGISGMLMSIIQTIECVERHSFKIALFPKSKEHSYASN